MGSRLRWNDEEGWEAERQVSTPQYAKADYPA